MSYALLGLPALALMALPPLSDSDRAQMADLVVEATVVQVYAREETTKPDFVDTRYVLEIEVASASKGEAAAGSALYVHAWRPSKRPAGWAGPQGQNHLPAAGAKATFYLRRGAGGRLGALAPNGIQP